DVLKRKAAERKRNAAARLATFDVDQLERAAAKVTDDAVRLMDAGNNAERGELGFPRSGQNLDGGAADALGGADEVRTVAGVAASRRRDRPYLANMQRVAKRAEAAQRPQRRVDGFGRK